MPTNNITALKFKDSETTATGPAFMVHYKITNTSVEGALSIITPHGIRYNGDDIFHVRNVIAEACNEESTVTEQYGTIGPDQVMVLGWSAYTA